MVYAYKQYHFCFLMCGYRSVFSYYFLRYLSPPTSENHLRHTLILDKVRSIFTVFLG